MIEVENVNKILFGGDYNPEQWPREIWEEDMRLFKKANVDIVTLNVFSWASLQPSENVYDFSKLDEIMELVHANGLKVCLATATAAHPAWMVKKYPDILRTNFDGSKRKFGGRHNSCPNSLNYQKFSTRMAEQIANRYQGFDNIVAWHVSNEYGETCYCENCEKAFRVWLQDKYQTIAELNRAWNTAFWGHTFYDWDEIVSPTLLSEHFAENRTMFQGISLDYKRFNSDSLLKCYEMERDVLRKFTPDLPITTNMMGFYKTLDYQKWAKQLDFISWDNYPSPQDTYSRVAMSHDLMRSLKGGKPFSLMEQTPSVTNWQPYNALKRPGVNRLHSLQAVAHGSDTVMYFQMRRSIGACEKMHGALIDHAGHENTRVFRECSQIGEELVRLEDKIIGSYKQSKVAILFDWDNWWAAEFCAGPTVDLSYVKQIEKYYEIFSEANISVDFLAVDDEFDKYELIIAPNLYMVKPQVAQKLEQFTASGKTFVTTVFSGIVDENDLVKTGGYPGELRQLLGIWVEETDALPPDVYNEIQQNGKTYASELLWDIIHPEGAEVVATHGKEFYAGMPVVTKNQFGQGQAWYIGTVPEKAYLEMQLLEICDELGIESILKPQENIEVSCRIKEGSEYIFVLNHGDGAATIQFDDEVMELLSGVVHAEKAEICMVAKDVMIFERKLRA